MCRTDTRGDATAAIIAQIERFAPGFRDRIIGHTARTTTQMAAYNPNYVGGDIMTGAKDIRQLDVRAANHVVAVSDRRAWHVHLLGGHTTRTRRARHVRGQRRPVRAHRTRSTMTVNTNISPKFTDWRRTR